MTTLSDDRRYRYSLVRLVNVPDGDGTVMFVMLNPSVADEELDDPTVRRCIRFARHWGARRLVVTNLSPLRATDPQELLRAGPEPAAVWERNLKAIRRGAEQAFLICLAWGALAEHPDVRHRVIRVIGALHPWSGKLYHLGATKQGHPRHPLMVKGYTREPRRWSEL